MVFELICDFIKQHKPDEREYRLYYILCTLTYKQLGIRINRGLYR